MITWLAWPAIKTFLGKLPWKNIIIGIAITVVVIGVVRYIRTAEENRSKVTNLERDNAALVEANHQLEESYTAQLTVLQGSIEKSREREKNNAAAIEEIRAQPDSACARNSLPLRTALRLYNQRHAPD